MPLNSIVEFYLAIEKLNKLKNLESNLVNKSFLDFACKKLVIGISSLFKKPGKEAEKLDEAFLKVIKEISES